MRARTKNSPETRILNEQQLGDLLPRLLPTRWSNRDVHKYTVKAQVEKPSVPREPLPKEQLDFDPTYQTQWDHPEWFIVIRSKATYDEWLSTARGEYYLEVRIDKTGTASLDENGLRTKTACWRLIPVELVKRLFPDSVDYSPHFRADRAHDEDGYWWQRRTRPRAGSAVEKEQCRPKEKRKSREEEDSRTEATRQNGGVCWESETA